MMGAAPRDPSVASRKRALAKVGGFLRSLGAENCQCRTHITRVEGASRRGWRVVVVRLRDRLKLAEFIND